MMYIDKVMDFDEVIKRRKMIREFQQDRQISAELIRKLLKNAHRSPSAGHCGSNRSNYKKKIMSGITITTSS